MSGKENIKTILNRSELESSKERPEKPRSRTPSCSSDKTITFTEKENGNRHLSPLKSNLPKLIPVKKEDSEIKGDSKPAKEKPSKPKIRPDKNGLKGVEPVKSEEIKKAASKKLTEDIKMKKDMIEKIKESKRPKEMEKAGANETEGMEASKDIVNIEPEKNTELDVSRDKLDDDSAMDFQSCLGMDESAFGTMEGSENKKISEEVWLERQNLIITDLNEVLKDMKEPKFDKTSWMNKTTVNQNLLKGKLELRSKKLLGNEPIIVSGPKYVQELYDQAMKEILDVWVNTSNIICSVKEHTMKFFGRKSKSIDKEQLVLEGEMLQLAIDFAIHFSRLRTDFLMKKVKNRVQVKEIAKSELEKFMESKTLAALYTEEDLSGMAHTILDLSSSICKEK